MTGNQPDGHDAPTEPDDATVDLDGALSGLAGLPERPPAEHVAVYEEISARLQRALSIQEVAYEADQAGDA